MHRLFKNGTVRFPGCRHARRIPVRTDVVVRLRMCQCIARQTMQVATSVVDTRTGSGGVRKRNRVQVSTPGFEPGLLRPQRDVLTSRRCGPRENLVFYYRRLGVGMPGHRPFKNGTVRSSGLPPRTADTGENGRGGATAYVSVHR